MNAICDAHKKVGVELLYNSVHRNFNQLGIRRVGEDAVERTSTQRGCAPRPPVEQPRRTGKKRCFGYKNVGQYAAVLFGLQLPLTVKPLVILSNPFK